MRMATFSVGFASGLVCTVAALTLGRKLSADVVIPLPEPFFVRCAQEVDSTSWQTYRSTQHSFEFLYPPDYNVRTEGKNLVLESLQPAKNDIRPTILIEPLTSTLAAEQTPEMRLGSWKVADRQVWTFITPYFTGSDPRSLSETYLFVRNFSPQNSRSTFRMVRATITLNADDPILMAAKNARFADPESILTEPEQILSTFRFLQNTELPGRDGGKL